jgi:hypothetical protein
MHCFYHPQDEAAGVCRNCGRGVCRDCIEIVEDAIACRGKCTERVAGIQRMLRGNQRTYATNAKQLRQGGIYALFSGGLFVLMGIIFMTSMIGDFGRYMGAIMIGLGALIAIRGLSSMRASTGFAQLAAETTNKSTDTSPKKTDEYINR